VQSSGCFSHLNIPRKEIEETAADLGVLMAHVEIWDFNHDDQVSDRSLGLLTGVSSRGIDSSERLYHSSITRPMIA
jgi:hypothetical protein